MAAAITWDEIFLFLLWLFPTRYDILAISTILQPFSPVRIAVRKASASVASKSISSISRSQLSWKTGKLFGTSNSCCIMAKNIVKVEIIAE